MVRKSLESFIMSVDDVCIEEINNLKKEFIELTLKSKELKHNYHELLIENLQKDLLISDLKNKIENHKYESFTSNLSENCLTNLKLLGDSEKDDQRFVEIILKEIYGESLKNKSLSGRSAIGKSSEISLDTKTLLRSLFNERVQYVPEIGDARRSQLNKFIRNTIDKAKRQNVKQSIPTTNQLSAD